MFTTAMSLIPSPTRSHHSEHDDSQNGRSAPVIVVVEGIHDVEFLQRLTAKLHQESSSIPDLGELYLTRRELTHFQRSESSS